MYCTYDGYFKTRACFKVSKLALAFKTNSPDPLPTSSLLLAKNNRLIWNQRIKLFNIYKQTEIMKLNKRNK